MKKYLYLEDGTTVIGTACGASIESAGEIVFNTSMVGYQEALSDPSYANQLLTFTYPLIGTYGVKPGASQSPAAACQAAIIHTLENEPGPAGETLNQWLIAQHIPGICNVDTRALTKHIRSTTTMKALLLNQPLAESFDSAYSKNWAHCKKQLTLAAVGTCSNTCTQHVALIDFGVKKAIIDQLQANGCIVTCYAPTTSAAKILADKPDGVLLSNGPGDPADFQNVLPLIQTLQQHCPVAGICLGHQLIALANGAKTVKLPFGHRGINHPVYLCATGQTLITSQNHGYTVDKNSLAGTDLAITAYEVNDGTVEGLRLKHLPVISVQFHPEAHPGPQDATGFFKQFLALMEKAVTQYA